MTGTRLTLLLAVGGLVVAGGLALWLMGGDADDVDLTDPTPLQQVLGEIDDDGSWSPETALRAFAAVVGPLPGVTVPEGPEPAIEFGTVAIRMLARYFDEITPEQQRAAVDAAGPLAAYLSGGRTDDGLGTTGTPVGLAPGTHALAAATPAEPAALAAAADEYETLLDGIIPALGSRVGRTLGITVNVVVSPDPVGILHATAQPFAADGVNVSRCEITMLPKAQKLDGDLLTSVLAHEAWHCFQYDRMGTLARQKTAPPWIIEGQALWAGEAYVGGTQGLEPTIRYWNSYLLDPGPGAGLFTRAYDAIGFYAHLHDQGIDPWTILDVMLDKLSNVAAFDAAVGSNSLSVVRTWAPSWYRDGAPTATFSLVNAPGIPPVGVRPGPDTFTISNGTFQQVGTLQVLSAALADVSVAAEILVVDVMGQAVFGDMMFGEEVQLGPGSRTFCMIEDCSCPDGSPGPGEHLGEQLRVAVTGDALTTSDTLLRGWSVDEWCSRDDPPPVEDGGGGMPCGRGCASSNGDPHLTTVDGRSYGFQAAGEFTLLRSGDTVIQARQEPYRDSTEVAINTAIAVGVGSQRTAVYADPSGLTLVVNGTPADAAVPVSVDGIEVRQIPDGLELALGDGTVVWVLGAGEWGINVVVAPSEPMRTDGVGLLGPAGESLLPRLTDGGIPDIDDLWRALYVELAGSWEVTASSTLFDYADGAGPGTFRTRSFPDEDAPFDFEAVEAALRTAGLAACAGLGDEALLVQCAFDVAVTGDDGFVETYEATDRFLVTAIDEPVDGSITGGALEPLLTDVAFIGGAALADDGLLHLSVRFDDQRHELVTVDPSAQRIVDRIETGGDGQLAAAGGSVWLSTATATGCAVVRYRPEPLAEEATVEVPCVFSFMAPQLVAGDGTVLVYGAGREPTLTEIDPITHTLGDTVALPFAGGFLRGTADAIFYSGLEHGVYRLLHGADVFEHLGADHFFVHPGGTGIWEERPEGSVSYFDGSSTAAATFPVEGRLVGATADAALVERNLGSGPELWAYPVSGVPPVGVAVGPQVGVGGAERTLDYRDSDTDALLVAGSHVVKVWLEIVSGPIDESAVFVQEIAAP